MVVLACLSVGVHYHGHVSECVLWSLWMKHLLIKTRGIKIWPCPLFTTLLNVFPSVYLPVMTSQEHHRLPEQQLHTVRRIALTWIYFLNFDLKRCKRTNTPIRVLFSINPLVYNLSVTDRPLLFTLSFP